MLFTFVGTQVEAYCEQQISTIRHVKYQLHVPPYQQSQRCDQRKKYRYDRYVLHSMLAQFKVPFQVSRCLPNSHTSIRYLRPFEKIRQLKA